jgi:hypothetical protein
MAPPRRPDQRPSVADLPLRELASGVDALYLSGRPEVPGVLRARLEEGRQLAEGTTALLWGGPQVVGGTTVPIPFDLGGDKFDLGPHGWGKYRYCLDQPDGRVGFTTSPAHLRPARTGRRRVHRAVGHAPAPGHPVEAVA